MIGYPIMGGAKPSMFFDSVTNRGCDYLSTQRGFYMNKFFKSLTVLAALATFSSPAAAQLSGFLSLDGPNFGVRVGLNYAAALNPSTTLTFGARYNLNISPSSPSSARLFGNAEVLLSNTFSVGGRVQIDVSSIGLGNTLGLTLRPYASLVLVTGNNFGLVGTLTLNAPIVPGFALQPWLSIDGAYLTGPLQVNFGAEADFSILPAVGFDGIFAYVHGSYQLSNSIGLFAGTAVAFSGGAFGLTNALYLTDDFRGIYAGLNFALSNAITIRAVGGYLGGVNFTLTSAFKL